MVHLLSQLEVQRLEVVQREEELTASRQKLRREQEVLQVARARLETLEAQLSESQEQLGRELEKSRSLEEEREQLEEKLRWLSERSGRREVSQTHAVGSAGKPSSPLKLCVAVSTRRPSRPLTPPRTGSPSRRAEALGLRALPLPPAVRGAPWTRS